MQNYESPTIEAAGGVGNEIEQQTVVLVLILLVGILAAYLAAAAYTTAIESVLVFHAAAFSKTLGVSN